MDPNCWEMLLLPPPAQELLRFACTRMVHSYKPVLVGIFLDRLPDLVFPFSDVARDFVAFYRDREAKGLPIERKSSWFLVGGTIDDERCALTAHGVIRNVFSRYHGYASLSRAQVHLAPSRVWDSFRGGDTKPMAELLLQRALEGFYDHIAIIGEAVYGRMERPCAPEADELVLSLPDTDDGDDLFGLRAGD